MTPHEALHKYFGFTEFRSGQEEIINHILEGKQVVAVLPTGGGKSICYQIPALLSDQFSVIISPLIALMKDQVDNLLRNDIPAAFINSTMTFQESMEVLNDIRFGKIKMLYLAPERLESISFSEKIKELNPGFLFIDEAHCISEWGHNFRPSYIKIKEFIDFTGIKKIAAFTATATKEVIKDIAVQLNLKNPEIIVKGFKRENLHLNVICTKKKNEVLLNLVKQNETPAIVYTSGRNKAEEAAQYLNLNKIPATYYHAGMNSIERRRVQENFINDKVKVICATNAFGMGIDKKDIRLIVHLNAPGSIENYYQEIGRAGRDGKESFAYLLFDEGDIFIQNYFLVNSHPDKEVIQGIYNALCDYGRVAINMIPEFEIPLNPDYINAHLNKKISKGILQASLRYLEHAGYIKQLSEYDKKYSIHFLETKEYLRKFVKTTSNQMLAELVVLIIREYGGAVFSGNYPINIRKFAGLLNVSESKINTLITSLDSMGILSYEHYSGKEAVLLTANRVEGHKLKLDYKRISDNFINQQRKIEIVRDFVYTNDCRFNFILKYFGEETNGYTCGKCDKCSTNIEYITESSTNFISEKILLTFLAAHKSIKKNILLNILAGKSKATEFYDIETYGSCRTFEKSEIDFVLTSLINRKYIAFAAKSLNNLELTNKGEIYCKELNLSSDDNKFNYKQDLELFNMLREERSKAAQKFSQTVSIICPDNILREIASLKPTTEAQLLGIEGFNSRMFTKIGPPFLEVLKKYYDEKAANKGMTKKQVDNLPDNLYDTLKLIKKGYSFPEIAEIRNLTQPVISMQIESILDYNPDLNINNLFDKYKTEIVYNEIKNGYKSLKELKERLPRDISYSIIRILIAKYKNGIN